MASLARQEETVQMSILKGAHSICGGGIEMEEGAVVQHVGKLIHTLWT